MCTTRWQPILFDAKIRTLLDEVLRYLESRRNGTHGIDCSSAAHPDGGVSQRQSSFAIFLDLYNIWNIA